MRTVFGASPSCKWRLDVVKTQSVYPHTSVQQTTSTGFATLSSTASVNGGATPGTGGLRRVKDGRRRTRADGLRRVNESGPAGRPRGTGGLRRPVEDGRESSGMGGLRRPVNEAGDAGTGGLRRSGVIFMRAADSRLERLGATGGLRRDGAGDSGTAGLRRPNGEAPRKVRRVGGIFGIVVRWVVAGSLLTIFRSKQNNNAWISPVKGQSASRFVRHGEPKVPSPAIQGRVVNVGDASE